MEGLAAELEARARSRFVRWDAALWQRLLEGPGRRLADALHASGVSEDHGAAVLESYLSLGAEGIGLGTIVPEESGARTFMTLAWLKLIPDSLASLPARRQLEALATCFNLGENLEASPVWVRRLFLRALSGLEGLSGLEDAVARVSSRALDAPGAVLKRTFAIRWIHLAEEDHRFLPGALHFIAPLVACVHDRHKNGEGGTDVVSFGVFLDADPMLLGPMGCGEAPAKDPGLRLELLEDLERHEPRACDWFSMAANEWRAAVTLETSQFLVALLPA